MIGSSVKNQMRLHVKKIIKMFVTLGISIVFTKQWFHRRHKNGQLRQKLAGMVPTSKIVKSIHAHRFSNALLPFVSQFLLYVMAKSIAQMERMKTVVRKCLVQAFFYVGMIVFVSIHMMFGQDASNVLFPWMIKHCMELGHVLICVNASAMLYSA